MTAISSPMKHPASTPKPTLNSGRRRRQLPRSGVRARMDTDPRHHRVNAAMAPPGKAVNAPSAAPATVLVSMPPETAPTAAAAASDDPQAVRVHRADNSTALELSVVMNPQ